MVTRLATGRGVAQQRPSGLHERAARWLFGLLASVLVAVGAVGLMRTASTATAAGIASQEADQSTAVAEASRVSAWIGEVDHELDGYAAAMVGDSTESPTQLAATFQTLLTGTNDFSLLELTELSGHAIAASSGSGINLAGARWLAALSATPLVSPVTGSGGTLDWFVGRLATTGTLSGALVGVLQASQVANLLSPVDPDATATPEVQAVLPGGILLYSSAMTTTLHSGLSDASMMADGALRTRVFSPAVTAALAGRTGAATYTADGVRTVAGYGSVSLPGWVLGIVVSQPSGAGLATVPALLGPAWLVPSLLILIGLVLLAALAARPRVGALAAVPGGRRLGGLSGLRGRAEADRKISGRAETASSGPAPGTADRTVARAAPAAVGSRLGRRRLRGRYEILEVIGRGGEGQVLRALDHLHSRQVAIKVRYLDPRDGSRRRETLNEASVLLRMTPDPHASVVREDFIIRDRYYLVMDWIDGTPLDRRLAERGNPGLPVGAVLHWMGQVAGVLDHLHSQVPVIVHGDVKPSNVILTSGTEPHAILVDFGISQLRDGSVGVGAETDPRAVMGSPGYMAPEMLAGARATPAADVFGLAATTFALMVGHPPRFGDPPDWGKIDPRAAGSVEAAFKAGLAVDLGRRPHSARGFITSLRAATGSSSAGRRAATVGVWTAATLPDGSGGVPR